MPLLTVEAKAGQPCTGLFFWGRGGGFLREPIIVGNGGFKSAAVWGHAGGRVEGGFGRGRGRGRDRDRGQGQQQGWGLGRGEGVWMIHHTYIL